MMRSSSRLSTPSSAVSISRDLPLRLVLVQRVGIETAPEQLQQRPRQPGMAAERRPHVVLGEGRAGLAEIARDGADQRHVAPGQAGIHGQRIVAVALGVAVPDRHEGGERERRDRVEVEGLAVGAFEIHVVDEDRRPALRLDLIGLLVDDPKPHVLEHRDALREGDRPAEVDELEENRRRGIAFVAMEDAGDAAGPRSVRR